jgi:acyl carrier protein
MDELEKRLAACFSAVLPELTADEIPQASATSVKSWDSVATITLIAVVEEEFEISIDVEDPAEFDSFERILAYLREVEKNAG